MGKNFSFNSFFIFLVGLNRARKAQRGGSRLPKKTRLIIGSGPVHKFRLAGRVRV